MGPGGIVLLVFIAAVGAYILVAEKTFQRKDPSTGNPFEGMAKISVQLVKAPRN